jgi:hypothetical protein
MGVRDLLFVGVVLGGAGTLCAGLLRPAASAKPSKPVPPQAATKADDILSIVSAVDVTLRRQWEERGFSPARAAPELAMMRRLSLALTGSIPSLEEIRRFETRPEGHRVAPWLDELLRDRRHADYLAERFARAFVGTEDGPFLLFRRRRFRTWLSDAFLQNRAYNSVVRDMIADTGLWTDHPATNFVSVTVNQESQRPDPERLGARVARAFLGVRLDCAQCHDHPFQPWKQADFRGLAAYFGGLHANLRGVSDGECDYQPQDRKTKQPTKVQPRVPFHAELASNTGSPREQLAAWVVNARNPNFARATVNRMWALLFGKPLVEPVDDLPVSGDLPRALEQLAADFSGHGYDLHRLIRVIVATQAYGLDSASESEISEEQEAAWAAFPMTRLRPEQVAGSVFQAASLSTLDSQSHWFVRLTTYTGTNDFVKRYGDTGEDEFDARSGTIPQRLILLNGDLVREKTKDGLLAASTQIAQLAPDDAKAVEVAYLVVLTRRPTRQESEHFVARLSGTTGDPRKDLLTDLCWTLINTSEFSWNH